MNRRAAALALAAAFLGTGCFVGHDDDVGTVNLYWDFVRSAPAQGDGVIVYDDDDGELESPNPGNPFTGICEESAVEAVTIESPAGRELATVDCVFGGVEGVSLDVIEGNRPFRFIGWRGAYAVYDRTVSLAVRGNAVTDHFVDLNGVSQPLDLFADLATGAPPNEDLYLDCAAAGSPTLEFEVRDGFFGELVLEGAAGCADALPAPVFVGDLELDNFDVRMRGIRTSDGAVVFDSCPVALDHFTAQTGEQGFAALLLTNPVPSCQ